MAGIGDFMHLNRLSQTAAALWMITTIAVSAGAWPHKQGEKALVRFLATSTLFRTTRGTNEDAYLAEMKRPKKNERILVRLMDAYPNRFAPLSRAVLQSPSGTVLIVKRDIECDRPFGQILLRTAPGDPMAILPERMSYTPAME
jgi:hypothetical protein